MRFQFVLDCFRPCMPKVADAERRADDSLARAQKSAVTARRRLGALRIVIETADQADEFFEREREREAEKADWGHRGGR